MTAYSKNTKIISMNGGFVSNAMCDTCTTVIPAEAGLNEMLERMELRYLQTFYERYGSIRKAAERLKLPPTTFLRHWEQLRQKYGTSSAEGKE